jgi:hypothetical protein
MKKLLLLILLLATSASAQPLSKKDWALEAATYAFLAADWGQSRDIAEHPNHFTESNFILGDHPSTKMVDEYFLTDFAVHLVITRMLPPKYRPYWQLFTIGLETNAIETNYSSGVIIRF